MMCIPSQGLFSKTMVGDCRKATAQLMEYLQGNKLLFPVLSKATQSGGNSSFVFGATGMQGWRLTMEDACAVVPDLDQGKEDVNSFFAVYDGHGSPFFANFASENLHKRLVAETSYQEKKYEVALKGAFLGTDEDVLANPELSEEKDRGGCTAVVALLTPDAKIYVANAGDSRCFISTKGESHDLSHDHSLRNIFEKARVLAAGGTVENGYVHHPSNNSDGVAMTRALGDFKFKKNASKPESQIITANPDIICHETTDEDEFLVLMSDGILECLFSQQVVNFVRYQISEGKSLAEICEMMCDYCVAPDVGERQLGGEDNMTIIIVAILHGRTKEEWYAWITDRVKNGDGYKTPTYIPGLYSADRLKQFRDRKERLEANMRREELKEQERLRNTEDREGGATNIEV